MSNIDDLYFMNTNKIYINNIEVDLNHLFNFNVNTTDNIQQGNTNLFSQFTNIDISNITTYCNIILNNNKLKINYVPTVNNDAINKLYVDSNFVTISGGVVNKLTSTTIPIDNNDITNKLYVDSNFVNKSGGVLNGLLQCGVVPTNNYDLVNKQYVDSTKLSLSGGNITGTLNVNKLTSSYIPLTDYDIPNKLYVTSNFMNISGGNVLGNINMNNNYILSSHNPSTNNELTNKLYVDSIINNKLDTTGGTITGELNIINSPLKLFGVQGQSVLNISNHGNIYIDNDNMIGGRLTILDNGNIGINNNNPNYQLDVSGIINSTIMNTINMNISGRINGVSAALISYLSGVTSSIQDQLNSKLQITDFSGSEITNYLPIGGGNLLGNLSIKHFQNPTLTLTSDDTNKSYISLDTTSGFKYNSNIGDIIINNNNNILLQTGNNKNGLYIDSSNNIGIGKKPNNIQLDVCGNMNVDNILYVSNDIITGLIDVSGTINANIIKSNNVDISNLNVKNVIIEKISGGLIYSDICSNNINVRNIDVSGILTSKNMTVNYGDISGMNVNILNNNVGIINKLGINKYPSYSLDISGDAFINRNFLCNGNIGIGNLNPLYSLDISGILFMKGTVLLDISSTINNGLNFNNNNVNVITNLGINDVNPSSRLSIVGNAQIGFDSNTLAPTNGLIVKGNVGIGNTTAGYPLDINSSTNNILARFYGNTTKSSIILQTSNGDTTTISTEYADNYPTKKGDTIIRSDGNIVLQSNNFLVDKIGIGTITPYTNLHYANAYGNPTNAGTMNSGFILSDGSMNDAINMGINSNYTWIQSSNVYYSENKKKLVLQPLGGNVGINNTNPVSTLDISGSLNCSYMTTGGIYISNMSTYNCVDTSNHYAKIGLLNGYGNCIISCEFSSKVGIVNIEWNCSTWTGFMASNIPIKITTSNSNLFSNVISNVHLVSPDGLQQTTLELWIQFNGNVGTSISQSYMSKMILSHSSSNCFNIKDTITNSTPNNIVKTYTLDNNPKTLFLGQNVGINNSVPNYILDVSGIIHTSVGVNNISKQQLDYLSDISGNVQQQLTSKYNIGDSISGLVLELPNGNVGTYFKLNGKNMAYVSGGSTDINNGYVNIDVLNNNSMDNLVNITNNSINLKKNVSISGTLNNITNNELSYLSGASSSIQTQLNNKLSLLGGTISGNLNINFADYTSIVLNRNAGYLYGNGTLHNFNNTTYASAIGGYINGDYGYYCIDTRYDGNIGIDVYSAGFSMDNNGITMRRKVNITSGLLNLHSVNADYPTYNSRSIGTRLVLYSNITSNTVDTGIGVAADCLWNSVGNSSVNFDWYAGTSRVMRLSGSGNLSISGNLNNIPLNYLTTISSDIQVQLNNKLSINGGTVGDLIVQGSSIPFIINRNVAESSGMGTGLLFDVNNKHKTLIYGGYVDISSGYFAVEIQKNNNITSDPDYADLYLNKNGFYLRNNVNITGNLNNITNNQLSYLTTISSDIQVQLNNKYALTNGNLYIPNTNKIINGDVNGGSSILWNDTGIGNTNFYNYKGLGSGGWSFKNYDTNNTLLNTILLNPTQNNDTIALQSWVNSNTITLSGGIIQHTTSVPLKINRSGGIGMGVGTGHYISTDNVNKCLIFGGYVDSNNGYYAVSVQKNNALPEVAGAAQFYIDNYGIHVTDNFNGITPTQLGYLTTISSNIQVQLNNKYSTNGGAMFGLINFNIAECARPTFTNRSTGTRLVFYNNDITANSADTAIGMDSDCMWYSMPSVNNGAFSFEWYGGTTRVMKLDTSGNLTIQGKLNNIPLNYLTTISSDIQTQLNNKFGINGNTGCYISNQFTYTFTANSATKYTKIGTTDGYCLMNFSANYASITGVCTIEWDSTAWSRTSNNNIPIRITNNGNLHAPTLQAIYLVDNGSDEGNNQISLEIWVKIIGNNGTQVYQSWTSKQNENHGMSNAYNLNTNITDTIPNGIVKTYTLNYGTQTGNTSFVGQNVGIGVSNPQYMLDVSGMINTSIGINNISSTQLSYLTSITSNVQTQLNNKLSIYNGSVSGDLYISHLNRIISKSGNNGYTLSWNELGNGATHLSNYQGAGLGGWYFKNYDGNGTLLYTIGLNGTQSNDTIALQSWVNNTKLSSSGGTISGQLIVNSLDYNSIKLNVASETYHYGNGVMHSVNNINKCFVYGGYIDGSNGYFAVDVQHNNSLNLDPTLSPLYINGNNVYIRKNLNNITPTQLSYLTTITSNVQTQLNNKISFTNGYIDATQVGFGIPIFNGTSAGSRLVLHKNPDSSGYTNTAIGMSETSMWFGMPSVNNGGNSFDWYGGITNVMSLNTYGNLTIQGRLNDISLNYLTNITSDVQTQLNSKYSLSSGNLYIPNSNTLIIGGLNGGIKICWNDSGTGNTNFYNYKGLGSGGWSFKNYDNSTLLETISLIPTQSNDTIALQSWVNNNILYGGTISGTLNINNVNYNTIRLNVNSTTHHYGNGITNCVNNIAKSFVYGGYIDGSNGYFAVDIQVNGVLNLNPDFSPLYINKDGVYIRSKLNYPLCVSDSTGDKIFLHNNGVNTCSIGFDSSGTYFDNNSFYNYSWKYAGGKVMELTSDGNLYVTTNISVGDSNTTYPLYISTYADTSQNVVYFNKQLTGQSFSAWSGQCNTSIYAKHNIVTEASIASLSDIRIKKNIQILSDNFVLDKLNQINVTSYDYIDNIKDPSGCSFGVIAQEIREIIPDAVELSKDFIPNIYQYVNVTNLSDETYQLHITGNIDASLNDIIKIFYVHNNVEKEYITSIYDITNNCIIIKTTNILPNLVFIYGTRINDFHVIDKQKLGIVALASAKALYNKINEQTIKINQLENTLNRLMSWAQTMGFS